MCLNDNDGTYLVVTVADDKATTFVRQQNDKNPQQRRTHPPYLTYTHPAIYTGRYTILPSRA